MTVFRENGRSAGFTLIEVLVTLVIVSLATLGMAGMQTVSMRANNHALLETQAATLAQDIIERIRANPEADYSIALEELAEGLDIPFCKGKQANCNADEMARHDLVDWQCSLGSTAMIEYCAVNLIPGQLPDGRGSIGVDDGVYTVRIRWFDAASDETRSIAFTAEI